LGEKGNGHKKNRGGKATSENSSEKNRKLVHEKTSKVNRNCGLTERSPKGDGILSKSEDGK